MSKHLGPRTRAIIRMVTRRTRAASVALNNVRASVAESVATAPTGPAGPTGPVAPTDSAVPVAVGVATAARSLEADTPVLAPARGVSTKPGLLATPPTAVLDVAAVAAITLCALFLHRDGLLGGPAFYELDTRLFYYPLANWVSQQLHAGVFPLWLPGIFTGYPIFADGELGLAYPPQLALLAALPAPLAMVWLRALHVFLAGLFTYLYLRTVRLDPLPALGGSLVFALGSFLTAQMHHENIVRSGVWLPAVLLCAERSTFRVPSSAFIWSGIGAVAFAQSALGLHVQPVLMMTLALGLYALFRAFAPTRNTEGGTRNAYLPLITGAAIVVGGLALAAVQWIPLGEWALVSSRRGGVGYEFASAFEIAPQSLVTILFPYFFRLPDATTWWSLWQQWEIELYVGIPTLALMLVGLVFSRRVVVLYFVALLVLSLLIAMANYAPLVNLHQFLWSIPGFSFLRAPGRFSYLVVFACAALAAFGLQALTQRRLRILVALIGGVPCVALLAALLALLPTWRNFLLADPRRALAFVDTAYLSARAQYPIDPRVVVDGLLSALDFGNPKTLWSLVLLALTCLCFVAWVELGHRRALVGQALFVGLLAVDLLTFASDFHPRAPLVSLAPPVPGGVTAGQRVLLEDASNPPTLEPNQLLAAGVPITQGYSSLPSQRHVELDTATSTQPNLLDLWSAPFIVEPLQPPDLHVVSEVRFRAEHPIAAGFGGAPPARFNGPSDVGPVREIRLIGTLSYAFAAPQGTIVATLGIDGTQVPLRAGIELSERAYDRPSLKGLIQHQRAAVALDFEEATPEGEDYIGHLYLATLPLPSPTPVHSLTVTSTDPTILVEVHGLALIDVNGVADSLDLAARDGLQRVGDQVIFNSHALPRAYVLPKSQSFSPARHPSFTATQLVNSPDVDLHTMVLIEGDSTTPTEPEIPTVSVPSGSTPVGGSTDSSHSGDAPPSGGTATVDRQGLSLAGAATRVEDLGPNAVRVSASASVPSYLVLDDFYQRGWSARVDGQPAKVFIANALYRAVALDPGEHVVEFRFEPLSLLLGAAVSIVSLAVVLAALIFGFAQSRRRPRPTD